MKQKLCYLLIVLGLTTFYQLLLMFTVGHTVAAKRPDWWPVGIFASTDGLLVWMHLAQGFGVLLAALMTAWFIQRFFRPHWLSLSFCATLLPLLFMTPPFWQPDYLQSGLWWSGVLDTAKFVLLPPFCCWVMVKRQQLYGKN
ncbi:hypothetical protein [Rheinheimera sp. 4Y26]|uniref:hypothetical protein n=1 Tax=Rheinheimera sp. 4Y26 TaxID=2977811 RepID=UPI0021B10B65|nr:hypothetical protein [Rheinheimera sp. 4Y26]MCT6698707.1 hypothetical protein [Rheinheimera sp. 4Y26]